ncbi:MAG: hydantoinase/oxoprolinase N-terminal domain-containing protein, partial [Acidobacteriota bacterium]
MSDADARRQEEWRLWIDTGGTFTDCFATDPAGELSRLKVLSSSRLRGRRRGGTGREVVLPLAVSGDDDLFRGYVVAEIGSSDGVRVTASHGELLTLERDLDAEELELVSPEEAPAFAARLLTRTRLGEHLPPSTLRLATTKGTNALLERAGDEVGLVVNRGFADLLEIGDQARPDLFAVAIEKPKPFYRRVLEIDGRLDAQGGV